MIHGYELTRSDAMTAIFKHFAINGIERDFKDDFYVAMELSSHENENRPATVWFNYWDYVIQLNTNCLVVRYNDLMWGERVPMYLIKSDVLEPYLDPITSVGKGEPRYGTVL